MNSNYMSSILKTTETSTMVHETLVGCGQRKKGYRGLINLYSKTQNKYNNSCQKGALLCNQDIFSLSYYYYYYFYTKN